MKGIFVEPADLQKIYGCCYTIAHRKLQATRDILNKKDVTVREFCQLENLEVNDYLEAISKKFRLAIKL
jgi:hypothetical protein